MIDQLINAAIVNCDISTLQLIMERSRGIDIYPQCLQFSHAKSKSIFRQMKDSCTLDDLWELIESRHDTNIAPELSTMQSGDLFLNMSSFGETETILASPRVYIDPYAVYSCVNIDERVIEHLSRVNTNPDVTVISPSASVSEVRCMLDGLTFRSHIIAAYSLDDPITQMIAQHLGQSVIKDKNSFMIPYIGHHHYLVIYLMSQIVDVFKHTDSGVSQLISLLLH